MKTNDEEAYFSDNTRASEWVGLSADQARRLPYPVRNSGHVSAATSGAALAGRESRGHDAAPDVAATPVVDRGATATRGGRQTNTRARPLTAGRIGVASSGGRSEGTRPSPSTGPGGTTLSGGSRGGSNHATHTARPQTPIALLNPSTGRTSRGGDQGDNTHTARL